MPKSDALVNHIALTVLSGAARVAAVAGVAQTEKVMTSGPRSVCAILSAVACPAGKTLDLKIQGRNLATDGWTDLVTFVQVTNGTLAAQGVQRANVPAYARYRVFETTGGTAFNGTTDVVAYSVVLVGDDVLYAPIAQV